MDERIVLSVVDITSTALALKLAMYNRPRDSSSAISEAEPPIATTDPNTVAEEDTGMVNPVGQYCNKGETSPESHRKIFLL